VRSNALGTQHFNVCLCMYRNYIQCGVFVMMFLVALKRAISLKNYFLGLYSSRGSVVVQRLGPQRRKADGVPGGV